jgi:hypothetical protein
MDVFRKAGILVILVLVTSCVAAAQETQSPQNPPPQSPPVQSPPTQSPPVQLPPTQTPVAAPPDTVATPRTGPLSDADLRLRRNAIGFIVGVLGTAVRQGAEDVVRKIQVVYPGLSFLTGVARARGFNLDDYGVVFHVEIPSVRPSVSALIEQAQQRSQPRAERASGDATVFDPNEAYTEAVKNTLIDTMLTYSVGLQLRSDEWLTVVARDGDAPPPGALYESITMVIRERGSELAEFHAKRLTREDVLKRVQVRGF